MKRQRISIIKCRFLKSRNVRKYDYSEKLNDYKYIYQNGICSTCASTAKQKEDLETWIWIRNEEDKNLFLCQGVYTKKRISDNHKEYSKWALTYM